MDIGRSDRGLLTRGSTITVDYRKRLVAKGVLESISHITKY